MTTTYTSYDLVDFGKPLQAREREVPEPTGTQVLMRVRRAGVCHSDLHIQEGFFDLGDEGQLRMADRGMKLPMAMGHEILGEIIALGPDADPEEAPIGETRLVHPWIGCGDCLACNDGRENECTRMNALGIIRDGGYATHVLVDHPRFLVDVEGIDPDEAAPYACSGLTVYSALKKALPVRDHEWLAVIGAGGLGLAAINIAKALGVTRVASVDVDDQKLEAARRMGADAVLNLAGLEDDVAALGDVTEGSLLAVLDTVGAEATAKLGTLALKKTGRYVVVGLHGGALHVPLPMLPQKSMTIRGSFVGSTRELQELVALAREGKVKPVPIEIRPMARASQSVAQLERGEIVGRVVLTNE